MDEAGKVFDALAAGRTIDEVRSSVMNGSLLKQKARITRKRIWVLLHHRYFTARPAWIVSDLKDAVRAGTRDRAFIGMLYLHYTLRDHLTYDFVTDALWGRWKRNERSVDREDVMFLLEASSKIYPQIRGWSERTRLKLAGSTLTALRDFGVLEGTQKKRIVRPVVPLSLAEHILRVITAEGAMGSEVLQHPIWRLFLLEEHEVAGLLARLAQERIIRFERVGDVVVLETPDEWRSEV